MLASNVFLNCRSNYFDCDAVDLGDAHSLGIGNDAFDLVVLALYSVSHLYCLRLFHRTVECRLEASWICHKTIE